MKKIFTHRVEEINDDELKIYGNYMVDGFIIIKKIWIIWLINNIRKRTPEDFNMDYNAETLETDECQFSFFNTIKERDLSYLIIYPRWKNKAKKNHGLTIPYPAQNKHLIMMYIEPLLCDLEKYLSEDERKKLVKPWACNMTFEEWEEHEASDKKNSRILFKEEINPKDYFC